MQANSVAIPKKTNRQLLDEIEELHRRIAELDTRRDPAGQEQALRHLLEAADHERQLIAYEIHDGLAQHLAAAIMQFESCEHLREASPAKAKTAFDAALELLRQAQAEARRLINGAGPPILDESGLVAAIVRLVQDRRSADGPRVEFHSDVAFNRLPPVLENAVYRIAQEALTNACKHSRSERVRVMLIQEGEEVCIEVRDWGIGFDPDAVPEGRFGLEGIRERTRLLGGKVTIESRAGQGATVRAAMPLGKGLGIGD
ncbi:MAG: sensor histidine kinase [Thermoguttaceae bacterium]